MSWLSRAQADVVLWTLIVGAGAALAWAVAGQLTASAAVKASIAGFAAAAAAAVKVLEHWQSRGALRRARERTLNENLRFWSLPHGALRRVGEVDANDVGAAQALTPDRLVPASAVASYVPRPEDEEIRSLLRSQEPFVLVIGGSRVGKSRSAYEAARTLFPHRQLVIPEKPRSLDVILQLDPPLEAGEVVVWLDDLEEYLGNDGLTMNGLDALATRTPAATVLATIGNRERDRHARVSRSRRVLARAKTVRLKPLTDAVAVAAALGPFDDRFAARVTRFGLGASLVAGPDLADRLADEGSRIGAAIVRAAADWTRTGAARPPRQEELAALYPAYVRAGLPQDQDGFKAGLEWACEEIHESVALMAATAGRPDEFAPSEYIVDHLDAERAPIADAVWALVLGVSQPPEALIVGVSAYARGNQAVAEQAFRMAATAGLEEGVFNLALVLEADGRHDEAEAVLDSLAPHEREAHSDFSILTHDLAPGIAVISISGEIDLYSAASLRQELFIQTEREVDIVIDLLYVRFLDSAALGVLIGAFKRAAAHGRILALAGIMTNLKTIFRITGLESVLPIYDDVEDAIRQLERPANSR
jgi:anti-anti-sigma factor